MAGRSARGMAGAGAAGAGAATGVAESDAEFGALLEVIERDSRLLTEEQKRALAQEGEARKAHAARSLAGRKIDFSNLNATEVDCDFFALGELPPDICKFKRLTELRCTHNGLTELPAAIGELTHLRVLKCGSNQLTALPAEMAKLTQLRELYCNNNQLTRLPAWVGQLTNLQVLYCRNNRLAELPVELGQLGPTLRRFDCGENLLEVLPLELQHLVNLEDNPQWCNFTGNPLLSPPLAVAQQGAPAVVAYLRDLSQQGSGVLQQARVILVGYGGVGKSTTLRALLLPQNGGEHGDSPSAFYYCDLLDKTYKSTRGIDMTELELTDPADGSTLRVRVWDLAGQIEYYLNHMMLVGPAISNFVALASVTGKTHPDGDDVAAIGGSSGAGAFIRVENVPVKTQLSLWLRVLRTLQRPEFTGAHRRSKLVIVGSHVDALEAQLEADGFARDEIADECRTQVVDALSELPAGLLQDRLHVRVDLDADPSGDDRTSFADLQLLDLRRDLPEASANVDALRQRVAEVVRESEREARKYPVPRSYVFLKDTVDKLRQDRVDLDSKKSEIDPDLASTEDANDAAATRMRHESLGRFKYRNIPEVSLRELLAECQGIFGGSLLDDDGQVVLGEGFAHFWRALQFLETAGEVLVCGSTRARGGASRREGETAQSSAATESATLLDNCHVFLDLQWVSTLAGQFLAPNPRVDPSERWKLSTAEVKRRLRLVTTGRAAPKETEAVMQAMIKMDLCLFDREREVYLFPSLLQKATSEVRSGLLPPGHADEKEEQSDHTGSTPAAVARVLTFGDDAELDMVPPGLFSRIQKRLLERAGARLASDADVHQSLTQVGVNGTVIWAFELPSRLSIALAVSGDDANQVLSELSQTLRDVTELVRPFAGAVVTEHACCFFCLHEHFFPSSAEETSFSARSAGPILHPCSDVACGRLDALESSNLWSCAFGLGAPRLLSCRTKKKSGTGYYSQSPCELLTGRAVPLAEADLRALKRKVLEHFSSSLPNDVRDALEQELAVEPGVRAQAKGRGKQEKPDSQADSVDKKLARARNSLANELQALQRTKETFEGAVSTFQTLPTHSDRFEEARSAGLGVAAALASTNKSVLEIMELLHGGAESLLTLTRDSMKHAMSGKQWSGVGQSMLELRKTFYRLVKCYREEFLPSLPQARPLYECFIAHAGEQKDMFAAPMREWLVESGAVADAERVFVDQWSLEHYGNAPHDMFDAACRCRSAFFFASREAVTKPWCMMELCVFAARELFEADNGFPPFLLAPLAFAPEGQTELADGQKPWINILGSLAMPWGSHGAGSGAPTMPQALGSHEARQALFRKECAVGSVVHRFLQGADVSSDAKAPDSASLQKPVPTRGGREHTQATRALPKKSGGGRKPKKKGGRKKR